jgi:hypothetical protein
VLSNDPTPVYFVDGELLSYKQVCAKAIRLYQYYGIHDHECGRIIVEHGRNGAPPPLGHFQYGNFEHPIAHYPHLHRPVAQGPTGATNTMSPFQTNLGTGFNNDNTGYNQPAPVSPTGNAYSHVGFFGPHNDAGGRGGSGHGFNCDFSSPTDFNPGGSMSSATDYKSPAKYKPPTDYNYPFNYKSLADLPNHENDDLPLDDFPGYKMDLNMLGNAGAGMSSSAGNNQAFNTATYSRHMTTGQVKTRAGDNSGSFVSVNDAGNMSNNPFARNFSDTDGRNLGSVSGPSLSTSTKNTGGSQDSSTSDHRSTSVLTPSSEPAMHDQDGRQLDEQIDIFALMEHHPDDVDTD